MKQDMNTYGDGSDNVGRDKYVTNITEYREEKIPRYLTKPPSAPKNIVGREADLSTVSNKLWHENHLLLLMNGEGGIGKTTLAATYWLKNATKYQHLAWLYVDTDTSIQSGTITQSRIRSALFSLASASKLNVTFDAGMSDEDRWNELITKLVNLKGPCLLVLDNANDPVDLGEHYQDLGSLTNFHVVLTTRVNELAEVPVWKVEPLDRETATSLFTSYYPLPNPADAELLLQVLVAVGYNTLAIELLAKNLCALNKVRKAYTLQNLLADLQQKGLLHVQAKAIQTPYGSTKLRTAKPDEIVRAMYDLNQLNDPQMWLQVRLLNDLAVLPAESITLERLDELLTFPNGEMLDDSLLELHRKGWVDFNDTDKTVKVSPVVQAVVRDKNQANLLTDCAGLIRALTRVLGTLNYTQAGPYANYASSVTNALPDEGLNMANLRSTFGDFNMGIGNLSQAIGLFEKAKAVYKDNDSQEYFLCLERLGLIHLTQGQREDALHYFKMYNDWAKEHYKNNPRSEDSKKTLATSYERLGLVYRAQEKWTDALTNFTEYNKLVIDLSDKSPDSEDFKNGLAVSYEHLGDICLTEGNLDDALDYFNKQNELALYLSNKNPDSEDFKKKLATSYGKLGNIYQEQNLPDEVLANFKKQNMLFEYLYASDPRSVDLQNGLGVSYFKLGEIYLRRSDNDQAYLHFEKAEKIWSVLCEQVGIPEYCNNLAEVRQILAALG